MLAQPARSLARTRDEHEHLVLSFDIDCDLTTSRRWPRWEDYGAQGRAGQLNIRLRRRGGGLGGSESNGNESRRYEQASKQHAPPWSIPKADERLQKEPEPLRCRTRDYSQRAR